MCKRKLPREKAKLLDIRVIVIVSKDPESLLPDEMIRHYESVGVTIGFVPLLLMGKAKSMSHLCPDLSSSNPADWGAYRRFYTQEKQKKRNEIKNQRRVDHMLLIGDDYYFTNPWRKVAQLGHLSDTIIRAYSIAAEA
jgi:hypothetical protein